MGNQNLLYRLFVLQNAFAVVRPAADRKNNYRIFQTQTQNTLFSLGMLTYTYERQDIIQIALKRLPGGGGVP
jgi:hypothetical protein